VFSVRSGKPYDLSPTRISKPCVIGILGSVLDCLKGLQDEGWEHQFRSIIVDPPFTSEDLFSTQPKKNQNIDGGWPPYDIIRIPQNAYWEVLKSCFYLIKALLHMHGSLWIHSNVQQAAKMRLLANEIFGAESFCNEISWYYGNKPVERKPTRLCHYHGRILVYGEISHNKHVEMSKDAISITDFWHGTHLLTQDYQKETFEAKIKEKPPSVVSRVIQLGSSLGDWVLDCFCGEGSYFIEAARLGRNVIGCEAHPETFTILYEKSMAKLKHLALRPSWFWSATGTGAKLHVE
jgi:DNA modification methylase